VRWMLGRSQLLVPSPPAEKPSACQNQAHHGPL
jgi:hypothetical protein